MSYCIVIAVLNVPCTVCGVHTLTHTHTRCVCELYCMRFVTVLSFCIIYDILFFYIIASVYNVLTVEVHMYGKPEQTTHTIGSESIEVLA